MLRELNQEPAIVTCDEAVYALAKEVQWGSTELTDIVLRMGGFHRTKNFLGVIGKRMASSGFDEILEESGIYGSNHILGILKGKHYYRGVNAHKVFGEALLRLYWTTFEMWMEKQYEQHPSLKDDIEYFQSKIETFIMAWSNEPISKEMIQECFKGVQDGLYRIVPYMEKFDDVGKASSRTFQFWREYLDMIFILFNSIEAERDSNWHLHLEAFQHMLPYDKSFDHYKYFSWGIVYLSDMIRLPHSYPNVYEQFLAGKHTVSRAKATSVFNSVATDMALEQSFNRDSKMKGGMTGCTHDNSALEKWTLTSHLRAAVTTNLKVLCAMNGYSSAQKDLSKSLIKKSESSVASVLKVLESISNPFKFTNIEERSSLINVFNGIVLPDDLADQLLNAKETGKNEIETFVRERLQSADKKKFWDKLPKTRTPTFESANKEMTVKSSSKKTAQIKIDKELFQKILVISRSRNINLEYVLSFELSPFPLAITHPNGEMRKTQKSQLLKELQVDVTETYELPIEEVNDTCVVVDLMGVVQSVNPNDCKSFGDLCLVLMNSILKFFKYANMLIITPDRYDMKDSIKAFERAKRTNGIARERIINDETVLLPSNLKTYLSNIKKKSNFVTFFLQFTINRFKTIVKGNQKLMVGLLDGSVCIIDISGVITVEELKCDHEETDSPMFVYCAYVFNHYNLQRIIISSPDTDVAIIACYHVFNSMQGIHELWFLTGSGKNRRFIPLHEVADTFGSSLCKMLPTFHCLTGCDSTASFSGIGKKKALKILMEKRDQLLWLEDLGTDAMLDTESQYVKDAIKFVCWLYDPRCIEFNINKLRYKLFCKKNISGEKLPPTLDALLLHFSRAAYQSYIWKNANVPMLDLPTPVENKGWTRDCDGYLAQNLMTEDPAPKKLLELLVCTCKSGCAKNTCSCRKNCFCCTDACNCISCENENENEYLDSDDQDEDEFDDDF